MTVASIPAPLAGKVAIVTGGSRGIGAETVLEFTRRGVSHIAITYLSARDLADKVIDNAKTTNPELVTTIIQADVKDPNFGKEVLAAALKGLNVSHIDIVVSNAAIQNTEDFANVTDITKEIFDQAMTAQAWAPLSLATEAIKVMPSGGRIILNSSGASKMSLGDPLLLHSASKAAMDAIARSLGRIYGKSNKITVNSIGIGSTDTDSLRRSIQANGQEFEKMCKNLSPLGRLGTPKEVANIISFVASPEASWMNSNQIPANGGALSVLQS